MVTTIYLGIAMGGTFKDLVLMDDGSHVTTKALIALGQLEDGLSRPSGCLRGRWFCRPGSSWRASSPSAMAPHALIERHGAVDG